MSDFKQKDAQAKQIFQKYNKLNFNRFVLKDSDEKDNTIQIVEFALSQIDEVYRFLLTKEYIDCCPKYWWNQYYSKTTYYRIKNQAIDAFLTCL